LAGEAYDEVAEKAVRNQAKRACIARPAAAPYLARIVVAIDPAVTSGEDADETGIIVVGKDQQGHGYVLADASGKHQPIE
jgi:phage terminase large subunit-like protein